MTGYRVCFLNEIPRNEKLFRCCQRSIVVRSAEGSEQAVEIAKKQFVRLEGIRDWRIHAAHIEVEAIDPEKPVGRGDPPAIAGAPWGRSAIRARQAQGRLSGADAAHHRDQSMELS